MSQTMIIRSTPVYLWSVYLYACVCLFATTRVVDESDLRTTGSHRHTAMKERRGRPHLSSFNHIAGAGRTLINRIMIHVGSHTPESLVACHVQIRDVYVTPPRCIRSRYTEEYSVIGAGKVYCEYRSSPVEKANDRNRNQRPCEIIRICIARFALLCHYFTCVKLAIKIKIKLKNFRSNKPVQIIWQILVLGVD